MNRDYIEPGRTAQKFAEAFAITGGVGAVLYPLIFYYVGGVLLGGRDDFLYCTGVESQEKTVKGESFRNDVRTCINYNLFMMCLYLALHFILFSRPASNSFYNKIGKIFALVLVAEVPLSVINFIFIGISICNTGAYGAAAIISTFAVIAINAFTVISAACFFVAKTTVKQTRVAVAATGNGGRGETVQET